jgi:hypothetical protein
VLVRLVHLVEVPPEHVDAEREDRGDDPAYVVVLPFCLARIGRWQVLSEPAEAGALTGTKDKDYNLIWYVEACLSNALRLDLHPGRDPRE